MSDKKTKEDILDKHYQPGMHWKVVNRQSVLVAMDEYADEKTASLNRIITRMAEAMKKMDDAFHKAPEDFIFTKDIILAYTEFNQALAEYRGIK